MRVCPRGCFVPPIEITRSVDGRIVWFKCPRCYHHWSIIEPGHGQMGHKGGSLPGIVDGEKQP